MAFSRKQIEVAAAWWGSRMPGAVFGMEELQEPVLKDLPPIVRAVTQVFDEASDEDFQRHQDEYKKFVEAFIKVTVDVIERGNTQYIKRAASGSSYIEFVTDYHAQWLLHDIIEEASMGVSDINMMPWKTTMYMHDDGQIFVPEYSSGRAVYRPLWYEGKPAVSHDFRELGESDFAAKPTLSTVERYRVVPLSPGQHYSTVLSYANGYKEWKSHTAGEGEVLVLGASEYYCSDFENISVEDMFNEDPRISFMYKAKADEFVPGAEQFFGSRIEATDTEGIVLSVSKAMPYFTVQKPMQVGYGYSHTLFEKGDLCCMRGAGGYYRVQQKDINRGGVRFLNAGGYTPPSGSLSQFTAFALA